MYDFITLVTELNKDLDYRYRFELDMVHQTPPSLDYRGTLDFICYAPSIKQDSNSMPTNFTWGMSNWGLISPEEEHCIRLKEWINVKLFTFMLNNLLKGKSDTVTEYVRLRIAIHMIEKLNFLKKWDQIKWEKHLITLYYARRKVIFNFYYNVILELPF